jgi:3-phosphoshikimate 1-carboxyvinyltransferase
MYASVQTTKLSGSISIPGSKSHTIRALIIATLAEGTSRITAPLHSADTRSCLNACRALGADIREEDGDFAVTGTGGKITAPKNPIDVGNSGTTLYLAAGAAALAGGPVTITGDEQTKKRPIEPLLAALRDLGAEAYSINNNGSPPITVKGPIRGGKTSIECPTSQYLSSLLLCTPLAGGNSEISVPLLHEEPYVEMTLRWLREQGLSFNRQRFKRFFISGGQRYRSFSKRVPADFSSATFPLCAAALTGSQITVCGLDPKDSQGDREVVAMLEELGCSVDWADSTILITGPEREAGKTLTGSELDMNATPDALPALAVTACFAEGETRLVNVPQARLKETDRIAVMRTELEKMGADIMEREDGLIINGRPQNGKPRGLKPADFIHKAGIEATKTMDAFPVKKTGAAQKRRTAVLPGGPAAEAGLETDLLPGLKGAEVNGHSDHRVVMALVIAGLGASGNTTVETAEAANITYPGFFQALESLGAKVTITNR